MALQKIFTPQYTNFLREDINPDDYNKDSFPFKEEETLELMGVEKPEGLEEKMLDAKEECDAAIALYEAYQGISPLFASQRLLWVYLTHVDLFNYVKQQWPDIRADKNGKPKTEADSIKYIRNHWFYSSNGPMRTTLMGLWWSVYLTVDNSKDDKYELTRIFFINNGLRTRRLGTGQLGRNREALKGILGFIRDNRDIFDKDKGGGLENRMIWITRHFNLIGGNKPLGCMSADFFYNELNNNKNFLEKISRREDVTGPEAFI